MSKRRMPKHENLNAGSLDRVAKKASKAVSKTVSKIFKVGKKK